MPYGVSITLYLILSGSSENLRATKNYVEMALVTIQIVTYFVCIPLHLAFCLGLYSCCIDTIATNGQTWSIQKFRMVFNFL